MGHTVAAKLKDKTLDTKIKRKTHKIITKYNKTVLLIITYTLKSIWFVLV